MSGATSKRALILAAFGGFVCATFTPSAAADDHSCRSQQGSCRVLDVGEGPDGRGVHFAVEDAAFPRIITVSSGDQSMDLDFGTGPQEDFCKAKAKCGAFDLTCSTSGPGEVDCTSTKGAVACMYLNEQGEWDGWYYDCESKGL